MAAAELSHVVPIYSTSPSDSILRYAYDMPYFTTLSHAVGGRNLAPADSYFIPYFQGFIRPSWHGSSSINSTINCFVRLSHRLSVRLSVCLSNCPSVRLSVRSSVCPSLTEPFQFFSHSVMQSHSIISHHLSSKRTQDRQTDRRTDRRREREREREREIYREIER